MKYSLILLSCFLMSFNSLTACEGNNTPTEIIDLSNNPKSFHWEECKDEAGEPVLVRRQKPMIITWESHRNETGQIVVVKTIKPEMPQQEGWFQRSMAMLLFWKNNN